MRNVALTLLGITVSLSVLVAAVFLGFAFWSIDPMRNRPALLTVASPYDAGPILTTPNYYLVSNGTFYPLGNTSGSSGMDQWGTNIASQKYCFGVACTKYAESLSDGGWRGVGFCP